MAKASQARDVERFSVLAPKAADGAKRMFYYVEVHPDDRSMNRGLAELQGRTARQVASEKIVAACLRYEFVPGPHEAEVFAKVEPIGTIFFSRLTVSPAVVAHELAHAAIGWCRRVKIDPTRNRPDRRHRFDQEELFASCLQSFTEQFWAAKL